jgi:hypothetical protein
MGPRLADAEVGISVPNGNHRAIYYNRIGVLGSLGQLPLGRGKLEQEPLKACSIEEVHLRPTIPCMATKLEKPLDLLLPNTALAAPLSGMCGVFHCHSSLRCENPSCFKLGIPATGSTKPIGGVAAGYVAKLGTPIMGAHTGQVFRQVDGRQGYFRSDSKQTVAPFRINAACSEPGRGVEPLQSSN